MLPVSISIPRNVTRHVTEDGGQEISVVAEVDMKSRRPSPHPPRYFLWRLSSERITQQTHL